MDDLEERKISALTSYYSGILIDPRSVREASDKLPEPEKLRFKTLDEAKACIARKTPALEALFETVGAYLAAPQDIRQGPRAGMCFDDDGWGRPGLASRSARRVRVRSRAGARGGMPAELRD